MFIVYIVCISWNNKKVIELTCTVKQWKFIEYILWILYYCPKGDHIVSKHVAIIKYITCLSLFDGNWFLHYFNQRNWMTSIKIVCKNLSLLRRLSAYIMCDLNPGQILEFHLITYLSINISAVTKSTECNFFKFCGRYISLYT